MKTSFNGLLSLIGAIAVFTTVSVCFSNCSSEDDFGEMEEIFATMAQKKMTRAGIEGWPTPIEYYDKTLYRSEVDVDFSFENLVDKKTITIYGITILTNSNFSVCDCRNYNIDHHYTLSLKSKKLEAFENDNERIKINIEFEIEDEYSNKGKGTYIETVKKTEFTSNTKN